MKSSHWGVAWNDAWMGVGDRNIEPDGRVGVGGGGDTTLGGSCVGTLIGDDLALGVCIDKLEAAVGIHGWTNVEAILGMKIPRALGS